MALNCTIFLKLDFKIIPKSWGNFVFWYYPPGSVFLNPSFAPVRQSKYATFYMQDVFTDTGYAHRKGIMHILRKMHWLWFWVSRNSMTSCSHAHSFMLVTDHKPLPAILGPKKGVPTLAAARTQRWALILVAYQYQLQFRSADEHKNADMLSRLPLKEEDFTASEEPSSASPVLTACQLCHNRLQKQPEKILSCPKSCLTH